MIMTALGVISSQAADQLEYAHIVANGNDPYASFAFHDGKSIDPETVKWAAVRYRTITEKDSTGVQLSGQLYVLDAKEPFIPITYKHTQKWETAIVDLTAVSSKTSLTSVWNSTGYNNKAGIRFDPMEPDRDAEDAQNLTNVAEVEPDSAIDIAWIAFFDSKEKAEAYDGTQDTPACILLPADLAAGTSVNAMSVEVKTEAAEAGGTPQQSDPAPSDNPGTSDASVVAIATLACIALAGVVFARKVR